MKTIPFLLANLLLTVAACTQVDLKPAGGVLANTSMPPFEGARAPTSEYDSPPRLLSGKAPVYPITRLLNGTGGEATVSYTISEDGATKDIVVISATYPYFGVHAVLAVKEWRYQPALKAGIPVSVRVKQSFNYSIP